MEEVNQRFNVEGYKLKGAARMLANEVPALVEANEEANKRFGIEGYRTSNTLSEPITLLPPDTLPKPPGGHSQT